MSSEFGKILHVSVFGQSHGRAIGVVVDGLPAGEEIDLAALQRFLDRRRPGSGPLSTARKETDIPEFLSGLEDGKTCGAPLCAVIPNADQRSRDYGELADKPRPGHADFTAWVKWGGHADMRGGGHFSGRLTAPLCVAGGIAKQILARRGIFVGAHLAAAAGITDAPFPLYPTAALFEELAARPFPVLDEAAGERMRAAVLAAKNDLDSVGGVVECAAVGLPPGLGDPMFEGVENRLASALFGIPAVKGLEFGEGFRAGHHHGHAPGPPGGVQAHAVHRQGPEDRQPLPAGKRGADHSRAARPLYRPPGRPGGGGGDRRRPVRLAFGGKPWNFLTFAPRSTPSTTSC